MASAGSDDEQQQPPHKCCSCIPSWKSVRNLVITEEQPQPQPDQQEPRPGEAPRADEEEPRREENPRRAHGDITLGEHFRRDPRLPEGGVEDDLEQLMNTDLQSSKSKGKEKVDGVPASDDNTIDPEQLNTNVQSSKSKGKEKVGEGSDQNIIGVVKNDGPSRVEVDNMRKCVVCRRTTFDFRLHKWSEVCNHLVCDKCIVVTLNSRSPAEGVQIPDEDPVECPVEGCTQVLTAAQCRAYYRATVREAFSRFSSEPFVIANFSPRAC